MKLVAEKKAAEKTKGDKIEHSSLCKSSLQRFEGRNQHPGTEDRKGGKPYVQTLQSVQLETEEHDCNQS